MHRHSRLHSRADDDAPTAKAGRKRRSSIAAGGSGSSAKASSSSGTKAPAAKEASGSSPSESSNSSTGAHHLPPAIPIANHSGDLIVGPASPDALGLSLSLPVPAGLSGAPPSFPAYSRPAEASHEQHQQQQHQFPHFPSIDPAVIPLSRRYSDAGHGATFASQLALGTAPSSSSAFSGTGTGGSGNPIVVGSLPTSFVTSFGNGRSSFVGGGGGSQTGKRERPSLRPRALTLAGLPESLGCFSLVNSPEPSDAGSNSSAEEDYDRDEDDSMDLGDAVSRLIGSNGTNSTRTTASLGEPSAPPESHYPSPTFTCDSPSGLNLDPVADLRAILDNDPVPSSVFHHHHTLSPPPTSQPEFDFESFAASIEGPIRHSPTSPSASVPPPSSSKDGSANGVPTSLDELLSSTAHNLEGPPVLGEAGKSNQQYGGAQSAADRYPTPPSGTHGGHSTLYSDSNLNNNNTDTSQLFEPSTSYHLAEHIEKAISHIDDPNGRSVLEQYEADAADHAATAAMFASGFGVSTNQSTSTASSATPTSSAAQLSALGLSFGLPALGSSQQQHRTRTSRHNSFCGYPSIQQPQGSSSSQAPLLLPMATAPLGSGSPYSAQQASFAAALSATYTTAYPTLTLPIAGFDLPTMSSFKHDTPPSLFIPSSPHQREQLAQQQEQQRQQQQQQQQQQQEQLEKLLVGSAPSSSTSHFDRLARAWEERQRAAGYGANAGAFSSAAPFANLKNPFAHTSSSSGGGNSGGSNSKSTPAFYIPSSTATTGGRDRSP